MENWKDVLGYEGIYQVSDLGNVKSLSRIIETNRGRSFVSKEKILKYGKAYKGRLFVVLRKNNISKTFQIHKVVAVSFLGHVPCGHKEVVDHIDNNHLNNRLDNLQLITQRKNTSKDRKGYSSKYVGVDWDKNRLLWRSRIWLNGKNILLGHYEKEIEAHEIYQKKLKNINNVKL